MSAVVKEGPQWFKRAQRGLFGGKERITGNHVSPSKRHVRRHWLPNVQKKNLWSHLLNRHININVTAHSLRQIDRVGGVDNYLLHTSEEKLASETGVRLKKMLLKAQQAQDAAHATTLAAGAVEAAPAPAVLR